jgi:hypothetical protein
MKRGIEDIFNSLLYPAAEPYFMEDLQLVLL